jgi:hypothetical protein
MRQLAGRVIDGLRGEPLALTLIAINVLFIIGFALVFNEIAKGVERKDALVVQMLRNGCKP